MSEVLANVHPQKGFSGVSSFESQKHFSNVHSPAEQHFDLMVCDGKIAINLYTMKITKRKQMNKP